MKQEEVSNDARQGADGDNEKEAEEEMARLQREYERIQEQLKNLGDEENEEDDGGKS